MSKKKYYDEDGNRMRSNPNPVKPFYKKWWFALIIGILIFTASYLINKPKDVKSPKEKAEEMEEISESKDTHEKENRASTYTFDDFKGTYILFENQVFESGGSGRFIIDEDYYKYDDFWETSFKFEILEKSIEENILTLMVNVGNSEYMDFDGKDYNIEFELQNDGGIKYLNTNPFPFWSEDNKQKLYSINSESLQQNYNQFEIDYTRIIMTMISSELALDTWALNENNPIYISHTEKGEPLGGWPDADSYPEDVTHIRGHLLYLLEQSSDNIRVLDSEEEPEGIITYAPQGEGNINLYYLNQEGADRVSQEIIEYRGEIYINPFDPYFVADFIGRAEFIYE